MRLIDTDKLIDEVKQWYYSKEKLIDADPKLADLWINLIIATIKNQPAAFDVEKVVNQLEEEKEVAFADFEAYAKELGFIEDDDWFCKGLGRAIEIVKRG